MVGLQDSKVTKYMSVCARGGVGFDSQMSKQQGHRNAPGLKTPPGLH